MTAMYDDASPSMLAALAHQIADRHRDGRTCQRCTQAGCEDLAWAGPVLREHRAARERWIATMPVAR